MKPVIIEDSKIPGILSKLSPIGSISAFTLWMLIISDGKISKITKNHESIHVYQYNDLFVIGFLFVYYFDYAHGIIKYRKDISGTTPNGVPYSSLADKAYYRIRAEQEAYEFEDHDYYSLFRKKWGWLKKYKV
jgi:hypothetical protein